MYKGVQIGLVESTHVKPGLKRVEVLVAFERTVEKALTGDAQFWLVKPDVSLHGISGSGTPIAENYIAMRAGAEEEKPARKFEALSEPPLL